MSLPVDKRATKSLKAVINKLQDSKSAAHLQISRMITQYSHSSVLKAYQRFENTANHCVFVITDVLSPHFIRVVYIPPRRYMFTPTWTWMYLPWYEKAVWGKIKRVFDPFSASPYIKHRGKVFRMCNEFSHIIKLRRYYDLPESI